MSHKYKKDNNLYVLDPSGKTQHKTVVDNLLKKGNVMIIKNYPICTLGVERTGAQSHITGSIIVTLKCSREIFSKILKDLVNMYLHHGELAWAHNTYVDYSAIGEDNFRKMFNLKLGRSQVYLGEVNYFRLSFASYIDMNSKIINLMEMLDKAARLQILE